MKRFTPLIAAAITILPFSGAPALASPPAATPALAAAPRLPAPRPAASKPPTTRPAATPTPTPLEPMEEAAEAPPAWDPATYFNAVFEPEGRAVFPTGDRNAFGLLIGWSAARFATGTPFYTGGSVVAGPLIGPSLGALGYGGPLVGVRLALGPFGLDTRLVAGGAFGVGPAAINGFGPAIMPEMTLSLKVGGRGIAVSAGYMYVPSLPGLSGVYAGVGY